MWFDRMVRAIAASTFFVLPAAAAQTASQQAGTIEPKAMAILHASCDMLSAAPTMSFTAIDTYERAARNGQPLFYTTESQVTLQRPDKLRVLKLGDGIPDEFYYDGKTMTAYIPSSNLVAVSDAPRTIDDMLDAAWDVAGIYFPFSDVMVSHPCAVLDKNVTSAFYVGRSVVVGGTVTDMVAIAGDGLQAELWIGAKDHLPRMIRVSYPYEPAHAHYQTDYADWRLGGAVDAHTFQSDKAAHAARITFMPPPLRTPPGALASSPDAPGAKP
ncbi:MAG TPA: DUF2092 domain-containing protein [Acidocella sp.]|jgi:hypothetical protein|uniref:DUF2092 domain-containing protein n=1 Tax=Acidocella sp. TaxID=50710 RepID=UPI002CBBAF8C|nr:DUF2092 domain-containing protein [Acidocella sp.]HVE21660.1 DUF2092 domain-containing protein [Acidocella sp.]